VELPRPPLDASETLEGQLGLEVVEATDHQLRGTIKVRNAVKQGFGLVHGGVYAAAAESLASFGTVLGVFGEGNLAVGLSNNTSFLRPILEGTIHFTARRRHRGRTTWIWDVEATDDDERLCAITRVTIAVRPMPPAGSGS
jgi:uncharacterized protein (TIGR00369 family)